MFNVFILLSWYNRICWLKIEFLNAKLPFKLPDTVRLNVK